MERWLVLTGDRGRRVIGRSNLRVHGNAKIVLLDDGGVALIDALLHPFVERLADDRLVN